MKNSGGMHNSDPVVVEKPQSRFQKFARKTTKVLDWTVLPIHEIKLLGGAVRSAKRMIAGIFRTVWSILKFDFKSLRKSNFIQSFKDYHNKELFVQQLSADDKEALHNLPHGFFFKRIASLLFCLLACFVGIYVLIIGVQSEDLSIARFVGLSVMILALCFYTWIGLVKVENIIHSVKVLNPKDGGK